jgi:imidazolonepropionase-like amidohydrolase
MKLITIFSTLKVTALLMVCSVAGQAQITAIKAGKVVDPATGTTSTNQIILIEGKKIKAIGKGLPLPPNITVIDLAKSTVMPGLFDAHTHLCAKATAKELIGSWRHNQ